LKIPKANITQLLTSSSILQILKTPVSSINKTDRHGMTEIYLKLALNTTNQPTDQSTSQIQQIQTVTATPS
jgi:hypothetical protein